MMIASCSKYGSLEKTASEMPEKLYKYRNDDEKIKSELTKFMNVYVEHVNIESEKYGVEPVLCGMVFTPIGDKIKNNKESDYDYKYYKICPSIKPNIHPGHKVSFTPFIIESKYLDILIRE